MSLKAVIAAIVATGSVAATAEAREVKVPRAGIDFLDVQEVDAFHRDLARAAREACRLSGGARLVEIEARRECRVRALADAVEQVDAATLTVLHEGLTASQRIRPDRTAPDPILLAAVKDAAATMPAPAQPRILATR